MIVLRLLLLLLRLSVGLSEVASSLRGIYSSLLLQDYPVHDTSAAAAARATAFTAATPTTARQAAVATAARAAITTGTATTRLYWRYQQRVL